MNLIRLFIRKKYFLFIFWAKCHNIDAFLRHSDVIFRFRNDKSSDLRLPKLERMNCEDNPLYLMVLTHEMRNINDWQTVSIDVDCLVAYNKLFDSFLFVHEHKDAGITYV